MRTSWQSLLPPWSTKIEKVEKVEEVTMVELCWSSLSCRWKATISRAASYGITWHHLASLGILVSWHRSSREDCITKALLPEPWQMLHHVSIQNSILQAIHIWLILTCGPFMQTKFFGWCCAIATWSTCGESFQDSLKIGHGLAPVLGFCKLTRFKAGHIAKKSRRICHIPRFHANANAWAMAMILYPMVLILWRRELQPTRKTQGRSERVKKKKCHLRDHHGIMIGEQFALWIPRENRERIVFFPRLYWVGRSLWWPAPSCTKGLTYQPLQMLSSSES